MIPSWSMCSNSRLAALMSGLSRDRRTSGLNVVSDIVLKGCVRSSDLSEGKRAKKWTWRTARGSDPRFPCT